MLAAIEQRITGVSTIPTPVLVRELARRGADRVVTLQRIADIAGYEVITIKRWSQLASDPLPLTLEGEVYSISVAGLHAWLARRKLRLRSSTGRRGRATAGPRAERSTRSKFVAPSAT